MIGSLGLGLIGMGVVFIWAGVKDRKVGEFFAQLRDGGGKAPAPTVGADTVGGGDFGPAPAAYNPLPAGVAGPVLPRPSVPGR